MPTVPRYPPNGVPRCPICDMPYQVCTGHPPGWDSSPQYPVGIRLPRRVPVSFRGATTQAFLAPPNVKELAMAEKTDATVPAPRTGGVHRTYPRPSAKPKTPAKEPAPAKKPATVEKPAAKSDAA